MSVLKSLRSVSSQLYSTWSTHSVLWSHTNQAPSLLPPHSPPHTHFAALFPILYPFHFWSYSMPFTCSFSSPHLSPTSSFFLFSCHPPPPPLSSFSHAPVGEHNQMAMAALWCVCLFFCVMSHYVAL